MYPLVSQILMKVKFPQQIFEKYLNMKFHENLSRRNRVGLYGRRDRRTDKTNLIVLL
jgi:hypothetical protein